MTSNQIAWYAYKENERANKARERQTDQQNLETHRHNVVGERFSAASLAESARHNAATEGFNLRNLAETSRHNQISEKLTEQANKWNAEFQASQTDVANKKYYLDVSKEEQRILESIRDYEENVRNHNLQALTSKTTSTVLAGIASMLGIAVTGNNIAKAKQLKQALKPGTLTKWGKHSHASKLPRPQSIMLILDQIINGMPTITPNGDVRNGQQNLY